MSAIRIDDLTKRYGEVLANDGISFDVDSGEIFGYLGPNGAGKTTTIRLLLGLIKPTSGTATILGRTFATDERSPNGKPTSDTCRIRSASRSDSPADRFSITSHGCGATNDETNYWSCFTHRSRNRSRRTHGNIRMLGIVQAFMHDPEIAILDEPTSGLDPLKQDRLHQFLERERDAGKTIFSPHVLSEVQRVCDRVGIIREGELVALEDIDALLERSGKRVWVHLAEPVDEARFATDEMIDLEIVDSAVQFTYTGEYNALIDHLGEFDIANVEITDPQLDEIFKHYYGEGTPMERTDGEPARADDGDSASRVQKAGPQFARTDRPAGPVAGVRPRRLSGVCGRGRTHRGGISAGLARLVGDRRDSHDRGVRRRIRVLSDLAAVRRNLLRVRQRRDDRRGRSHPPDGPHPLESGLAGVRPPPESRRTVGSAGRVARRPVCGPVRRHRGHR
ncbi:ATP-binding cassette domain-containing protein [Natrialba swarupiae]|nr:ATP-binding cassette domain-containing protein [Natrialba swarupiae]